MERKGYNVIELMVNVQFKCLKQFASHYLYSSEAEMYHFTDNSFRNFRLCIQIFYKINDK
jgi:hypothetical protein